MTNSISGDQPTVTTFTSSTTSASGASGSLGASSVSTTANATVTQTANATNSAATSSIQTTGETVVNYTNSASAPTVTVSTSSSSTQATATSNKTSQAVAGKITSPDTSESSETSSTSSSDHIPSDYEPISTTENIYENIYESIDDSSTSGPENTSGGAAALNSLRGSSYSNYDDAAADYEPISTTENIYESIDDSSTSDPENTSGGAAALNSLRGSSYSNYDDAAADYEPISTTENIYENIYESIDDSSTSGPENTSGGAAALNSLRGSSYSNYDDAAADYEPISTTENIYESIDDSSTSDPENTSGGAAAALNSLRGSSYSNYDDAAADYEPISTTENIYESIDDSSTSDPENTSGGAAALNSLRGSSYSNYDDAAADYEPISTTENIYENIYESIDGSSTSDPENTSGGAAAALNSLRGSSYTTGPRNEGVFGPGPEGLPDMSLPSYDPTNKTSLLTFLSNPHVKSKMLENSGHFVFIDTDRSSFILVPNGNWDQVCSIKVQNGKTKEDLDIKDLENMCAKFCTGFNKFSGDWDSRVEPMMSAKAGVASGGNLPNTVIINNKFKTCVAYGPWNSREASSGYTPSAWRRGHQVNFGEIFEKANDFNKINWGTQAGPSSEDDGISFSNETPGAGPAAAPSPTPSSIPVINVNVNVGGTNVNIRDTNVNTTNTTPTTQSTDASTDTSDIDNINTNNQTDDINTTDKDSDGAGGVNGDISETESSSGDDSGSVSSSESDKNASVGNDGPAMKDILSAVRKHLDVVYPGDNGGSTEGPLQANQTLGDIVQDMETTGTSQETVVSPWKGSTSSTGSAGGSGSVQTLLPSPPPTPSTTTLRTGTGATTTSLMMGGPIKADIITTGGGGRIPGGGTLEKLLPRIRAHLDISFDGQGDLVSTEEPQLGSIVNKFRKETGSGGIVASVESAPGKPGSAQVLTGTGGDKGNLFQAAAAVTQALGNVAGKVNLAIQGQKLSSLVNDDGKGSVGRDLFQAATQTTQALSSLIDTVG
ncbi:type III secretion system actin-recruiting effector Tarp [Chlamydia trachomatis]|uniref:Translocated actin-recruiting phosphoprotein n=4 Tax=Chlamydia trachomatis TaxID=813 RepID=TARP_CHLT2|nr:type III secretion system actin-recruiting effector Tarp [Chlamydia trachomatis]Q6GX35.1 RecName: Full=Translocated actin-recruiting phosphoprotein; Short=Tarp protein [Chlamydia trachomatis 434/Bu]AAT47185.1 translocated actin-recruiting phosphoprotein [Chlamydia trachomatis]ADK74077.1 TarP [Chlamydia trachomatis]ADK74078.1 TarP [Chlamydia trachomatis]AGJ64825.1 translocated actin-recruiting phosphoprotein [Chlamydia trachomatis L2/434/Bu(i)]AGJ65767.1 translocated actin-recruiting phosph